MKVEVLLGCYLNLVKLQHALAALFESHHFTLDDWLLDLPAAHGLACETC